MNKLSFTSLRAVLVLSACLMMLSYSIEGAAAEVPVPSFSIGGAVRGLVGTAVLQNNGGDDLLVAANGTFRFRTPIPRGGAYSVTVTTQPANQTCVVANGSGTVGTGNVTSVIVKCATDSPKIFSVGGRVTGLDGSGVVLQNNGRDDLEVSADSAFEFATRAATGDLYSVTVSKQPIDPVQTCTVANGSGAVINANITAPLVTCATQFARFAYVANSIDNSVSIFTVDAQTGQWRNRGHAPAGRFPLSVTVHPSGRFAYVANFGSGTVSTFAIDAATGALTPRESIAVGATPKSVTVDPSGRFAYVVNFGSDTISAFAIDAVSGVLAQVAEVVAGTTPVALLVDPSGRFAYVANSGSQSISAFRIAADGSLLLIGTTPVVTPPAFLAADPSGRFVYVATGSNDVAAYRIEPSGALVSIAGSAALSEEPSAMTVDPSGRFVYATTASGKVAVFRIATTGALDASDEFAVGSSPSAIAVDPTGKFAFVTDIDTSSIWTFSIDSASGALTRLGQAAGRRGPIAIAFAKGTSPVTYAPKAAYVANEVSGNVSVFAIHSDGILEARGSTPESPDAGTLVIAVDRAGRFAYVANRRLGTLATLPIDPVSGGLGEQTSLVAVINPVSITVDPSDRFVYVATQGPDAVATFAIDPDDGILTPVGLLMQQGSSPISIAVDPSGSFAYLANLNAHNISAFVIDPVSGALGSMTQTPPQPGTTPVNVTVDPSGRFVYLANFRSDTVSVFSLDPVFGTLSTPVNVQVGGNPSAVTVDPSGRFAYVANSSSDTVSAFAIDPDDGILRQTSVVPAGTTPRSVAIDASGRFAFVVNLRDDTVSVFPVDPATGTLGAKLGDFPTGRQPESLVLTTVLQ